MTDSPSATPRAFSVSPLPSGLEQPQPVDTSAPPPDAMPAASPSLGLPTALKPIGIINEQNTCFLNSTFQALSATAPLASLLTNSTTSSLHPASGSILPPPIITSTRIPSLQNQALESPLYELLPVTRSFINSLHAAWRKKDAGGGTMGPEEESSARSMSLRSVLREIARKYDQYDDYRQQDAHELLRHLLDSMEMEEKDVIKRIQPSALVPPEKKRKRTRQSKDVAGISPMQSPLPSPATSAPGSPVRQRSIDPMFQVGAGEAAGSSSSGTEGAETLVDIPEEERLIPFVDVLFGGSLASVVVCERCKSVSHTYEGFLDISLSLKSDGPRLRKRDRFKALFRGKPSSNKTSPADSQSQLSGVMSDTELSDNERHPSGERDRRRSLDQDDRPGEGQLSRNSSLKTFGLKSKPSFSFGRRKGSRPGSSSSGHGHAHAADPDKTPPAAPSFPTSPTPSGTHRAHGPGPTPAQSAYIQRILSGPSSAEASDALAKIHVTSSGHDATQETGLVESLKAFTSVEVLEGENAFACKKCWKVKTGKYKDSQPALKEEDEDGAELREVVSTPGSPDMSASVASNRQAPPSISILGSDASSDGRMSPADERSHRSLARVSSLASNNSSRSAALRAPSPLRRQLVSFDAASDRSPEVTSLDDSFRSDIVAEPEADPDLESDGLSDTSSSDEEPPHPSAIHVGRPKMPSRRKSTHFVMRRAFKRYLIAKAPEMLVFHLKRFKQSTKTGLTFTSFYDLKKVDDFVSFPETLDLAPFLAPNRNDYKLVPTSAGYRAPYMDWASPEEGPELEPVMYRLYALVVHLGTMIGGHYIAYTLVDPEKMFIQAKDMVNAMADMNLKGGATDAALPKVSEGGSQGQKDRRVWCYCSDTSIRLASVDEVLSAKAYLCFYEKM